MPVFHPIRSKTKTNLDSLAQVFLRFASATCICFEFCLGHGIIWIFCDWLQWLLWFWLYGTRFKASIKGKATTWLAQVFPIIFITDWILKYLGLLNFCISYTQSNHKPFYAENRFMGSRQSSDVTLFGTGLLAFSLVRMWTIFGAKSSSRVRHVPSYTWLPIWTGPCLFLWCFLTSVNYYFYIPSIQRLILLMAKKLGFWNAALESSRAPISGHPRRNGRWPLNRSCCALNIFNLLLFFKIS